MSSRGSQWLIDVYNAHTETLPAYSSVELLNPIVDPEANERELTGLTGFNAMPVEDPATSPRIAITQEPIGPGKIGRAMIFGITPLTTITINNEGHTRAQATADGGIESADAGPLEILWKSPDTVAKRKAIVAIYQGTPVEAQTRWARIVSSSDAATPNRFDYTIEFVEWDDAAADWSIVPDTTVAAAINTLEAGNAATGVQGNGVNADTLPAGFRVVALGDGAIVRASSVTDDLWAFEVANLVDGTCQ